MTPIEALRARFYDLDALGTAQAVLDWDQQCLMPEGGAAARGAQGGILARMHHELLADESTGELIERAAEGAESEEDLALVRLCRRQRGKATCLPSELVEEKAVLASEGHETWVKARRSSDFALFAPSLRRMMEITRQEADAFGWTDHRYDALIDLYEEGATKADCEAMFDGLRGPLSELAKEIGGRPQPEDGFLHGGFGHAAQGAFTEMLVQAIGFSFERGRQDTAPHPFCTSFSVGDVRLTTRYQDYLGSAIFGSLHEAGHGLYEQGSPMAWDRLPLSGGVSLGVHESQSRTWENIIGRSRPFWERFLPQLKQFFPQLEPVGLDEFHRAVNRVRPSLIRVEADEVTYNLHVLARFELECRMIEGSLEIEDLPEAWNALYEELLGIRPDSDADGCLQDVHWSAGLIGYFPTYSMGNLLSHQIWRVLSADLGDVDALMAEGRFEPILGWLQDRIYSKGSLVPPRELILQATGKELGSDDFLAAMRSKYGALYGLA
jgi:carboxypeptidase Taq